jgi:hypothetical protein
MGILRPHVLDDAGTYHIRGRTASGSEAEPHQDHAGEDHEEAEELDDSEGLHALSRGSRTAPLDLGGTSMTRYIHTGSMLVRLLGQHEDDADQERGQVMQKWRGVPTHS